MSKIVNFFDRLEDHIRGALSHHPFIYSFFGGSGVILFWRGIWHVADYLEFNTVWGRVVFSPFGSIILGMIILLLTGLFVAVFIGDSIIMSGIKGEKKLVEKTEDELAEEKSEIQIVKDVVDHIEKDIHKLKSIKH
jgi:hypothetical protein